MKIVFCGPPHSGKSVFIANLIDKLPTDAYTIIRACPDGEGNWSNNKNQNETSIVRKKGKFTKSFIDNACKAIDNQTNKIVLVDVGGVMSKENEQVFGHCDSYVVLSNDEEQKKEWLEFGKKFGLECVGCLDSSLAGNEEIYSRKPYFTGKIVGLERGVILDNSQVINAIVSDIVEKSKYAEKTEPLNEDFGATMIDDTELGFELGYGKELYTEDGTPIKKVTWSEQALPKIYEAIKSKVTSEHPVQINGIRANFVLCAKCKAVKEQGIQNISTYDVRLKQYIPIKNLPTKRRLKQTEGLSYNIIENKNNTFIDIDITKEQYSLEDYEHCVLPKIKENKNLYLSGRIPLWLLASISSSYDSSKIFTFQPGKGFTCVSSLDKKELGTMVDGVDGININQYFEDKKNKVTKNLPEVINKHGIFLHFKSWFSNFMEDINKNKYLDDTIIANKISHTSPNINTFKQELQQGVPEELKSLNLSHLQNLSNKDTQVSKKEIGG